MPKAFTVKISWRSHNVRLVKAMLRLLAVIAGVMPEKVIIAMANKTLRLLWFEWRLPGSDWRRLDHGLTVQTQGVN